MGQFVPAGFGLPRGVGARLPVRQGREKLAGGRGGCSRGMVREGLRTRGGEIWLRTTVRRPLSPASATLMLVRAERRNVGRRGRLTLRVCLPVYGFTVTHVKK